MNLSTQKSFFARSVIRHLISLIYIKIVLKRKINKIFSNFCDFALDKLKIVRYNNNRRQHEAHMIINCAVYLFTPP